jgi:hypothetical protein
MKASPGKGGAKRQKPSGGARGFAPNVAKGTIKDEALAIVGETPEPLAETLASNMALDTADHQRECAAGLLQWPSIAASDSAVPVATTPYHVHSDSLFSVGNAPHCSRALAHVTKEPLLTADECAAIITEAEELGNASGWGSSYTNQASDEMEFSALPGATRILAAALPRLAATAVAALLPTMRASSMRVSPLSPPLIVRYDAAKRRDSYATP